MFPRLKSVLFLKCPRCTEGKFLEKPPYSFSTNKVLDKCPRCKVNYHLETSFYTGSMYVSYAVGVAIGVTVFVLSYVVIGWPTNPLGIFGIIVLVLILLMPYISAVSKSIWAHFFIQYNKNLADKMKNR